MRSKQVCRGLNKTRSPLQVLDFSLFIRFSSESQSFYTIESIVEIKQILQMNGSKTWVERNLSQHEVLSNFFSDFLINLQQQKTSYKRNDNGNPLLFLVEEGDAFQRYL